MRATVASLNDFPQAMLSVASISIAKMEPTDESTSLGSRFDALAGKMTKAAFARRFEVPGGASMVSQHVSGTRPISLDAAMAYARGFNVPLGDISRRLADQVREALGLLGDSGQVTELSPAEWPFMRITPKQWGALDAYDKVLVESAAATKLKALLDERAGQQGAQLGGGGTGPASRNPAARHSA